MASPLSYHRFLLRLSRYPRKASLVAPLNYFMIVAPGYVLAAQIPIGSLQQRYRALEAVDR
jgi:hypothetical protein